MPPDRRIPLAALLALLLAWLLPLGPAAAGVLQRADVEAVFPAPYTVGEREATLPVWPIFKQDATRTVLVGYVFESIDLAPLPGFSGTPMNLLVALDAEGRFLDVRVLSHHEPVFLDGLGEAPLKRFAAQYAGLSLKQSIKIGPEGAGRERAAGGANVVIDGVAKATASVRILNQSVLAAALQVARAKLGYAAGRDPAHVARLRTGPGREMSWAELEQAGLLQTWRLSAGAVDAAFAGSAGEAQPAVDARHGPDSPYVELAVVHLGLPSAARSLLTPGARQRLQERLEPGDHALLVVARGRDSLLGEHFVRGAVLDRLVLRQGELPLELRDLDLDEPAVRLSGAWRGAEAKVLRVIGAAGLDPAQPLDFALRISRSKGIVFPERVSRDFPLRYRLPADQLEQPVPDERGWQAVWRERAAELALLATGLAVLTAALLGQHRLVGTPRRLERFRLGFQLYTLVFVGWIAQGQLSIVNVTALWQAVQGGRDLGFFLHDPMTVVLWAYVLPTLVVWGRGSFCGWLCPFGALQELASRVARRAGVTGMRLHRQVDRRLKVLKYVVLAVLLGCAATSGPWTDRAVEVEPFKTAITLGFARHWPYVAWAAGLVLLGTVVYKGYCRYLCPLGAALALLGRLRRWGWIPRRAECGTPCQTCRHRCAYQAITPDGRIDYAECFQCLDCVEIHDSDRLCAPRILARRSQARTIPIRPVPPDAWARPQPVEPR